MKSILATAAVFSLTALEGLAYSGSKSGCNALLPDDAKPGKSVNLKLPSSSGVSPREYRLHLPAGYDGTEKLPLILSFHGRTRSAKSQEELSHFNETYGFEGISVYPQGVPLVNEVRCSQNIYMRKCQQCTTDEWHQNSTMGRRPRCAGEYQRRQVHPRTHRPPRKDILYRLLTYLCRRQIQRRRLHRCPSLRSHRFNSHRRIRTRIWSFLSQ